MIPSPTPRRVLAPVLAAAASLFLLVLLFPVSAAVAQITSPGTVRVATWNVTNYGETDTTHPRDAVFQTALYGTFEGRSMAPDVLIGQEFLSQAAVTHFVSVLNTAPGSPGDWATAPFLNGPDTDSAFFYRTSKVAYQSTTTVALGSSDPANQPRNTYRYDMQLLGSNDPNASILSSRPPSGTVKENVLP